MFLQPDAFHITKKVYKWSQEKAKFKETDIHKSIKWMENLGLTPKKQSDAI